MSAPPIPPLHGCSQQDHGSPSPDLQAKPLDESLMDMVLPLAGIDSPDSEGIATMLQEISRRRKHREEDQEDENALEDDKGEPREDDRWLKKPKKQRNTFSYAKKLVANHSIYLNSEYKEAFIDRFCAADIRIVGKIVTCPNKGNDQHFTITWETKGIGIDQNWLNLLFKKAPEVKEHLRDAIIEYEDQQRTGVSSRRRSSGSGRDSRCSSAVSEASISLPPQLPSPPPQPAVRRPIQPQNNQHSTPVRASIAFAALRNASTFHSHSSGASDDATARPSTVRRATRVYPGEDESESDDDEIELDETDNAWFNVPEGTTLAEGIDDGSDVDDCYSIADSIPETVGELLKELVWKLTVVEANSLPFQQQHTIRDDETRLKRGVSKSVVMCSICKIPAHPSIQTESNRHIHELPQFKGLSWFEILHSDDGVKMWSRKPEGTPRYSLCITHPIVMDLREYHKLPRREIRRRRRYNEDNEQDEDDER